MSGLQRMGHNTDCRNELRAPRDQRQHRSVVRSTRHNRDELKVVEDLREYRNSPRRARHEIARRNELKTCENPRDTMCEYGGTNHKRNHHNKLKVPDVSRDYNNGPENTRHKRSLKHKLRALEDLKESMTDLKRTYRERDGLNELKAPADRREPQNDSRIGSNSGIGAGNRIALLIEAEGKKAHKACGKSKGGNNIQPRGPKKVIGQKTTAGRLLCRGKIKEMATCTRADASKTVPLKEFSVKKGDGKKDPDRSATSPEAEVVPEEWRATLEVMKRRILIGAPRAPRERALREGLWVTLQFVFFTMSADYHQWTPTIPAPRRLNVVGVASLYGPKLGNPQLDR